MSTLRKYQTNPRSLLNTAFFLYKSKKIKTLVVEGVCDKRFLSQWSGDLSKVRFEVVEGKRSVEDVYRLFRSGNYDGRQFSYFFADVDYDFLTGRSLLKDSCFFYNAYCRDKDRVYYNDLEAFLINSSSLLKLLANMDIDGGYVHEIRTGLERASRAVGRLRVADIIVQREHSLRESVLNGIRIEPFFNPKDFSFDEDCLHSSIPRWSNYPHYVDDLIKEAKEIDRRAPAPWSLSRGHDLTKMLAMHLESLGKSGMTSDKVELMLRLGCEYGEFKSSPMGKHFFEVGAGDLMNYCEC